jgi:hypothetical protein
MWVRLNLVDATDEEAPMNVRDGKSDTHLGDAAPEPIGEIAAAIERTPEMPKPDARQTVPPVEPIGEIASAMERSRKPS